MNTETGRARGENKIATLKRHLFIIVLLFAAGYTTAGAIYLVVEKTTGDLPASLKARPEGRRGDAPGQGDGRPEAWEHAGDEGSLQPPAGLARPDGRHGGRGEAGLLGIGKSLLIVAAAVVLVSLAALAARRLRRKPPVQAAPPAPEPADETPPAG